MKIGYYLLFNGNVGYYDGNYLKDLDSLDIYEDLYIISTVCEAYLGKTLEYSKTTYKRGEH
jgi:hypothetical protein